MIRNSVMGWLAAACLLAGCGAEEVSSVETEQTDHLHSDRGGIGVTSEAFTSVSSVNPRRSLAVTETAILSSFTLTDVLKQLATMSGVPGLTATQLFQQLWDTQNPAPGLTSGPHCTDSGNTVNGFPYACRPAEGNQATNPAVSIAQYSAIGLFNRFDLAPSNGADCGEYRIVFARTSGGGRNFIIFEAVLENPNPGLGLEGCRPVADFWSDLTPISSIPTRTSLLKNFYFNGLPGFIPVIHFDNYGNTGLSRPTGQVRVNEFITPPWMLREFKLRKLSPTSFLFVPVSDKTNPFGNLFQPGSTNPQAPAFQNTFFPSQVAALAVNDINGFNYDVFNVFNTGQSDAQSPGVDDYVAQFGGGPSPLRTNIQSELTTIGSSLTPDDIVARAEALSCAGCHERSNSMPLGGGLIWPNSAGFVHATEFVEPGPDGPRFQLSSALAGTFLPHRKRVLDAFNDLCRHSRCTVGSALATSCDPCVASICSVDPSCCTSSWSATCVSEVTSVCGLSCP